MHPSGSRPTVASPRRCSTSCVSSRSATASRSAAWIAATNPFSDPGDGVGVELLTFHAAKGREWHTVVVTGVETGLVPHRSATTVEARAEEARLLHVAMTRASDELVVTRAERRRGYARQASPFIVGLPVDRADPVAIPDEIHRPPDPTSLRVASLKTWRNNAARASVMLPDQILSDDDLAAIATLTTDEPGGADGTDEHRPDRRHPPLRADPRRPRLGRHHARVEISTGQIARFW